MPMVWVVLGYGVPHEIRRDANYSRYLTTVANQIGDQVGHRGEPAVLLCGGPTDCFPPYRRTEADEMVRWFRAHPQARHWRLLAERRSLSTIENLLNARQLMRRRRIGGSIAVACEWTRRRRVRRFARKIFGRRFSRLLAVDFDGSPNRWVDPTLVARKERLETVEGLAVLGHSGRLRSHHQLRQRKLRVLREAGPRRHSQTVRALWRGVLT